MAWTREHETQHKLATYYAFRLRDIQLQFREGGEKMTAALVQFDTERAMLQHSLMLCFELAPLKKELAELAASIALNGVTLFNLRLTPSERIWLLQKAIKTSRQARLSEQTSKLLSALAHDYTDIGEYDKAIGLSKEALRLGQSINDIHVQVLAHRALTATYVQMDDAENAHHHLVQVSLITEAKMDKSDLALLYHDMGNTELLKDDPKAAIELYETSLKIAQQNNALHRQLNSLFGLTVAYSDLRYFDKAIQYAHQALKITQKLGDERNKALILGQMGNIYMKTRQLEDCITYYQQAIQLAENTEDKLGLANHYNNIGQAYTIAGNRARAIEHLEKARELYIQLEREKWIQIAEEAIAFNRSPRALMRSAIMQIVYWRVR